MSKPKSFRSFLLLVLFLSCCLSVLAQTSNSNFFSINPLNFDDLSKHSKSLNRLNPNQSPKNRVAGRRKMLSKPLR